MSRTLEGTSELKSCVRFVVSFCVLGLAKVWNESGSLPQPQKEADSVVLRGDLTEVAMKVQERLSIGGLTR